MDLIEKAANRQRELETSAAEMGPGSKAPKKAARYIDNETARGANPQALERVARQSDRSTASSRAAKHVFIDLDRLAAMGVIIPGGARTRLSEEFRIVKRPLIRKALSRGAEDISNLNLIMVTSAQPHEGKTFMALNLAMSLAAERDLSVLLIDADLTQPRILSRLGIQTDKGLIDLLEDAALGLSDVLVHTNIENLTLLPAGRITPDCTELLASARMREFVSEISVRYSDGLIVLDSPPLLASSEPSVLALHAGQIVFVVEAFRTSEAVVRAGLELISSCDNVALVLNKAVSRFGSEPFGSYSLRQE